MFAIFAKACRYDLTSDDVIDAVDHFFEWYRWETSSEIIEAAIARWKRPFAKATRQEWRGPVGSGMVSRGPI
jgi:hypothetical protein